MSPELAFAVALLLLFGNAFFVGAEFSLVSVRRSAIEPDAARGSKSALITLQALEKISFLMAGAQLGITLCSLGLGAVAEPAIAHALETPLHDLGVADGLLHPISFVIALIFTVFAHVVIGEMVPKNIALAKPERSALILTPMLVFVVRILDPIVRFLNFLANRLLKLIDIHPANEVSSTYTRDEMADLVKESRKEGFLSEDNEHLLSGALTFDAQTVRDIAMPVGNLVNVSTSSTYAQIEELSNQSGYSRFPVINKKKQIIGYVHLKDIIKADSSVRSQPIEASYIRPLAKVNATQSIRMTLKIMQRSGAHIALVHSGSKVLGLVTFEDVLEELVGEMSQQIVSSTKP